MSLRVVIDHDVCVGAGNCAHAEPRAFVLSSDSVAQVEVGAEMVDDARLIEVARACPSGAVELFEGDDQVDIFAQ